MKRPSMALMAALSIAGLPGSVPSIGLTNFHAPLPPGSGKTGIAAARRAARKLRNKKRRGQ